MSTGPRAQFKKLSDDCKGEFSLFLLWLFESPQIVEKLEELQEEFCTLTYEERRFLFVEGFLEVIAFSHREETVFRLLDFVPARRTEDTGYLFSKLGEFSKFRSPVLTRYFFRRYVDGEEVSQFIYEAVRRCDELKFDWNDCWTLFRRLMRYYNIRNFIDDSVIILNLYKRLQKLNIAGKDPLFWIQYSLSRIEDDDFDLSGRAIEKAKSLVAERRSRGNSFDSYQLDTHEAQYILKGCARRKIGISPVDALTDSIKLLTGVMSRRPDDTLHVCQTTDLFHNVLESWASELSLGDRAYIAARIRQFEVSLGRVRNRVGEDSHTLRAQANCTACLRKIEA